MFIFGYKERNLVVILVKMADLPASIAKLLQKLWSGAEQFCEK